MSDRSLQNCYLKDGPFVRYFDQHFSDLDKTIFRGDIEFYRTIALESEGDVLELGVGTGRVAIPVSLAGKNVVGLEISPFMLERAVANAQKFESQVEFRLGDMSGFDLQRKFGFIYTAFGAFHHLETVQEQLDCLRCVRQHINDQGLFAIHIRNPAVQSLVDADLESGRRRELIITDDITGNQVKSESIRRRVNAHMQWIIESWKHTTIDEQGNLVSEEFDEFKLRWIYRFEMEHLLIRCGFEPISCFSDFLGGDVRDEVQHIWVARPT